LVLASFGDLVTLNGWLMTV